MNNRETEKKSVWFARIAIRLVLICPRWNCLSEDYSQIGHFYPTGTHPDLYRFFIYDRFPDGSQHL